MSGALTVAIDGPSGSGKSSVARGVARHLGLAYLDTGAMYRAAACWVLDQGIDFADHGRVAEAVGAMPLRIGVDPSASDVWLDGRDITAAIREPAVSAVVSQVATNLAVRPQLIAAQRGIIADERAGGFSGGRGVVAEGRDITTVVAPEAEVRVILQASEEVRLARRAMQVLGQADAEALASTRATVVDRDRADSSVAEFMQAAEGVRTVDSSGLSLSATVEAVLALVREVRG
jgi:cytidylate kinase